MEGYKNQQSDDINGDRKEERTRKPYKERILFSINSSYFILHIAATVIFSKDISYPVIFVYNFPGFPLQLDKINGLQSSTILSLISYGPAGTASRPLAHASPFPPNIPCSFSFWASALALPFA